MIFMALPFGPLGHFFWQVTRVTLDSSSWQTWKQHLFSDQCVAASIVLWFPIQQQDGFHPGHVSIFPSFHHFHWMYLHIRMMCTTPFWARPSSVFFGCRWTTKQPWCALPIPLCGMLAAVVPSGHHATGSCWKHAPVMLPLMEVPKEWRLSVWREPEKSEGTEENLWVAGRFGASPKNGLRPVRGRAFKSNITNFEASAMRAGKQGSNTAQVMLPQNDWYESS